MPDVYTSRPMWLSKEAAYTLAPDGVSVAVDGGAAQTLPWRDIATVRIGMADPRKPGKPSGPPVYFCQLLRKGAWSPSIHFTHLRFTGLLTYENQAADYNAFLGRLTAAIAEKAPQAKFVTGADEWERRFITGFVWALAAGALVFSIMVLSGFWGQVDVEFPLFFGAMGLGLGWLGWKLYGWNGPKPLNPAALPASLFAPV